MESPAAQCNVQPGLINLALAEGTPIRRTMSPHLLIPVGLRVGVCRNTCCFVINPGEHRKKCCGLFYISLELYSPLYSEFTTNTALSVTGFMHHIIGTIHSELKTQCKIYLSIKHTQKCNLFGLCFSDCMVVADIFGEGALQGLTARWGLMGHSCTMIPNSTPN